MKIDIREDLESEVIYTASLDLKGLHFTPIMEDANAMAWQAAVEKGVIPEDSDIADYVYTLVES